MQQIDLKNLIRSEEEIASVLMKRAEMDKRIDLLDFESQIRSKIIEMIDPILQKTLKDREDIKHQDQVISELAEKVRLLEVTLY